MEQKNWTDISKIYFSHAKIDRLTIEKGDFLFKQGNAVGRIYFLKDGELNILLNNHVVWQAYHNEFIGLSSFFIGEPHYSSTVKAAKRSTLLSISFEDFSLALQKYPALNSRLTRLFNKRINLIFNSAKDRVSLTREKRLIKVLLEKAEKIDANFVLNYTISDMAEVVGVSTNFVSKILRELKKKRLIKVVGSRIELMDVKGLKYLL